jgi:hypothetical protein
VSYTVPRLAMPHVNVLYVTQPNFTSDSVKQYVKCTSTTRGSVTRYKALQVALDRVTFAILDHIIMPPAILSHKAMTNHDVN